LQSTVYGSQRGRFLDRGDIASAGQAVVISRSLAREEFGSQDPIGQRVHIGGYPNRPWYTIVGVAGDVKQASLAASDPDAVYITPEQSWFAQQAMSLVVRTRASETSLVPGIRQAIWSVNKDQPIVRVSTMNHLLAATEAERSFVLILFEVFAVASLALAAVGIYGVLSGSVAERTHEMGVRIALGARTGDVLRMVLAQGLKLTLAGVGIGIIATLALTRFLSSLLYGVKPTDPLTFIAVSLILTSVALAACYIPARRATKVDPMVALRYE
jgi:putative ABC transport system permease protein